MSINDPIDAKTEAVARKLANDYGRNAEYTFKSVGGALIPGWALFVSEADKIMRNEALLVEIRKMK